MNRCFKAEFESSFRARACSVHRGKKDAANGAAEKDKKGERGEGGEGGTGCRYGFSRSQEEPARVRGLQAILRNRPRVTSSYTTKGECHADIRAMRVHAHL